MSESLPPPLPPRASDGHRGAAPRGSRNDPTYNLLADKIGGVPNFRKKDNLYQAVVVAVFFIAGVLVGSSMGGWPEGVLLGAAGGLLAGILISGFVLMVIGLCRKS